MKISRKSKTLFALFALTGAAPIFAKKERPAPFWLSIPATSPEPVKSEAVVQFVSNGYFLRPNECAVIQSSGNAEADKHACHTVIFRTATKPRLAKAPVWIADPLPDGYVAPKLLTSKPMFTTYDYPSESLKKGEQGTVVFRVVVGNDGKVLQCDIASSSRYERLDSAVKRVFCGRLKLSPATLNGEPIESINFNHIALYSGQSF